jgi:phage tail sheath protein FI
MATAYKTPGVYVEEISKFPPSVAAVATAIPAFVGYTEKAVKDGASLINRPTRITSLLEYQQFFGGAEPETGIQVTIEETQDAQGNITDRKYSAAFAADGAPSLHIMYYALQAYFSNGGGPCYVASVGGFGSVELGSQLPQSGLLGGLNALENEDEPTLIVFPEAQAGLSLVDQCSLINDALAQCEKLQDRFVIADLHVSGEGLTTSGDVRRESTAFRDRITSPSVRYGAAYFPNIRTVFDYVYADEGIRIAHNVNGDPGSGEHNEATLEQLKETQGALYSNVRSAVAAFPVTIPPSAAVAGIYARVDESRGVWKAPANEGLNAVSALTFKVTDEIQENLNVDDLAGKSINAIRAFTGRGILVWGARTLDGNSNEWRYVPVRRFFNMVEESTKKATGRFVFEPNDANTWAKVRAMIENFLMLQWRAGALAGAKPEHAFYVRVGLGETMTALDILEGRMIVEIGMAVVRPAEFIILKFSHKMQES